MRSRKKKLVYFKKIPVRVDLEQWQRLDKIRADYHFKSTYEIMQYILGCFLRVADPMEKPCDFDPFGQTGLSPFGYNMIDPLKSWCWGSILFYPFKISRFS